MLHVIIIFTNKVVECINYTNSYRGYDIYEYEREELEELKREFPEARRIYLNERYNRERVYDII